MILIISTCRDKLHYFEFVKPVEDIAGDCRTKHYSKLTTTDLKKADRIIICGTSLLDNKFMEDINKFEWIKNTTASILGICAGMQIIGKIFGGSLKRKTEIGYFKEYFDDFLGLIGKQKVYHLYNYYVDFPKKFKIYSKSKIPHAVRYKNCYGVLFHPEVRQKFIIQNFLGSTQ
ncbi:MAG: hypothetical protein ABIC04_07665 [Nanoarchaeota archaeon]